MRPRACEHPPMAPVPPDRHLLRARDLIDARYAEPLDVDALARAAHASPAHFARSFRRAFGETPHRYLLTRRMERAAALLRSTDHSVARICAEVGVWPKLRLNAVVKEPTLARPTSAQIRATEWSVLRRRAAARSILRVSRYRCGVSPKARRNDRAK